MKRVRVGAVQRGESSGWMLSDTAGHGEAKSHRLASGLGHGLLRGPWDRLDSLGAAESCAVGGTRARWTLYGTHWRRDGGQLLLLAA